METEKNCEKNRQMPRKRLESDEIQRTKQKTEILNAEINYKNKRN